VIVVVVVAVVAMILLRLIIQERKEKNHTKTVKSLCPRKKRMSREIED
jgi:hypothetical protein